jgi:hypothetical protein
MTLDKTFENEVRKTANGDGGRDYKFALLKELKEVSTALEKLSSALAYRYVFDDCVKKYGRAKIALCVATTIIYQMYRYEWHQVEWAQAVMALWTNKCGRSISDAVINIHPSILADNSSSLRKLTEVAAWTGKHTG